MAIDPVTGVAVPVDATDPPLGGSAIAALLDGLMGRSGQYPRAVLYATSVADMTARYASVPDGTIAVIPSTPAVYMRRNGAWSFLSGDSGWTSSGVSAASGWSLISAAYRFQGPQVALSFAVTRQGADIVPSTSSPNNGDIVPDNSILNIPAVIIPVRYYAFAAKVSAGGCFLAIPGGSNTVLLTSGINGQNIINTGAVITGYATYFVD